MRTLICGAAINEVNGKQKKNNRMINSMIFKIYVEGEKLELERERETILSWTRIIEV